MSRGKIRWGDTLDDEEGGLGTLPPTTTKGPDSHGIKVVTEYYRNDKGDAFKKVTKSKVVNVEKKVYKVRSTDPHVLHPPLAACCMLSSGICSIKRTEHSAAPA